MRRTTSNVLACVCAALAGSLLVTPWHAGQTAAHAGAAQLLVVGDSIAVGLKPFLGAQLADHEVMFDAKAGRTTPQGMAALRRDLGRTAARTFVIDLGTNDGSDPDVFADRIRRVLLELPADVCVVWPAIYRPARKGPYLQLNHVLRAAARRDPRLTVIAYDRMVRKGTITLRDGLHPTLDGSDFMSYAIAAAVRRGC